MGTTGGIPVEKHQKTHGGGKTMEAFKTIAKNEAPSATNILPKFFTA